MSRKKKRKAQEAAAANVPTFSADPFASLKIDNLPAGPTPEAAPIPEDAERPLRTKRVIFRIEKKGRAGKVVTVVDGWHDLDVLRLPDIAQEIQRKIGSGGSVYEGTIELQGDQRKRAAEILQRMGITPGGDLR